MKKISIILVLIFALALVQPANASGDYAYLAEITSTSFLPSAIHAGDTVSLAIDVKNKGATYSIQELNAGMDLPEQFEAVETNSSVSEIIPGATKTIIIKFRVKEDTLAGYYNVLLNLEYSRSGETVNQTQNISVPVTATEKNLDVIIEPRVINPGKQTELIFTLKNIGGTPVSNISFSWEEENDLVLPLGSDNKRYVNTIQAGETVSVSYIVAADPNISTGIYPLNITMTFIDSNGTKTQTSQVGLIVGGGTDFEVSAETSSGQLSLSIANIGSNNASSVVVKIPEQTGINISGSNIQILGNLNKGDYTIASFETGTTAFTVSSDETGIQTRTNRSGLMIPGITGNNRNQTTQNSNQTSDNTAQQPTEQTNTTPNFSARELSVQIDYTDTTGERQSITKKIQLSSGITTTGLATGFSQRNTGTGIIPYVLLVLIVGAGIAFNKFKAKRNWKKTGIVLAGIIVLFAASIFLRFDLLLTVLVSVISVIALCWYFGFKGLSKAKEYLKSKLKRK